jgi:hypothetical protein
MKRVIIVLITLNISTVLFSQKTTYKLDYDPAWIIGTWIGTVGDKSYEFELQKRTVYVEKENASIELVLGSIKYLEKGKTVRVIPVEEFESPLIGSISIYKKNSDTTAVFNYKDIEKGLRGRIKFTLDPNDKNTVKWELGPGEWSSEEENNFDLPREMVLKRKK